MRKLLLSALLATGLTLSGAAVFAGGEGESAKQEEAPPVGATAPEDIPVEEVTGKVINFDEKLSTIAIETEDGEAMPLVAKHPTHLEDLKAGDMVTVQVAGGALALSITKAADPEDVASPGESGPAPTEEEAATSEPESAPEAQ